jgi:hypothetical protein
MFDELSYHSGKNHPSKIHQYGTHKYNLSFSKFTPFEKPFKLLNPVKSQLKKEFGKTVKKVQFHKENYVVIDWEPSNGERVWVKHSVENPLTKEKSTLFESKKFDKKDANQAIKIFKDRIKRL